MHKGPVKGTPTGANGLQGHRGQEERMLIGRQRCPVMLFQLSAQKEGQPMHMGR